MHRLLQEVPDLQRTVRIIPFVRITSRAIKAGIVPAAFRNAAQNIDSVIVFAESHYFAVCYLFHVRTSQIIDILLQAAPLHFFEHRLFCGLKNKAVSFQVLPRVA